jgi:hypothetical protein
VLQWVMGEDCVWGLPTFRCAAEGGHRNCVEWLFDEGCPWDASVCAAAAGGGHLALLAWMRGHGFPWDEETANLAARWVPRTAPSTPPFVSPQQFSLTPELRSKP